MYAPGWIPWENKGLMRISYFVLKLGIVVKQ